MILDGSPNGTGGDGLPRGIVISNSNLVPEISALITENIIDNYDGGPGILLEGCENFEVSSNDITIPGFVQIATPYGIGLFNSNDNSITDNSITGNKLLYVRGIIVGNSSDNLIQCNTITDANEGITFNGTCPMVGRLLRNSFNGSNEIGLLLEEGGVFNPFSTIIGNQDLTTNLWNGSFNQFGALHNGNFNTAINSRFFVQTNSQPFMPSFSSADPAWFTQKNGNEKFCSEIGLTNPGEGSQNISNGLEYLYNNSTINYGLSPAQSGQIWDINNYLTRKAAENPNFNFPEEFNIENNIYLRTKRNFNNLFKVVQGNPDDYSKELIILLNQLENFKKTNKELLSSDSDEFDLIKIYNERFRLTNAISELKSEIKLILESTKFKRSQNYAEYLLETNNIEFENSIGDMAKLYLELYILQLNDKSILNDSDYKNSLKNIAEECEVKFGQTVGLARILHKNLYPYEPIDYSESCLEENNQREKYGTSRNPIELFPNPSSGNVTIRISNSENKIQKESFVRVYNIFGQTVYRDLNTGNTLGLNDLQTGLYFVEIKIDNIRFVEKLIIN